MNQTDGVTKGVQLDLTLADRVANPQLESPSWKIKVTQLECPGRTTGFNLPSDEAVQDFPLLGTNIHFYFNSMYLLYQFLHCTEHLVSVLPRIRFQ